MAKLKDIKDMTEDEIKEEYAILIKDIHMRRSQCMDGHEFECLSASLEMAIADRDSLLNDIWLREKKENDVRRKK